MSEATPHRAVAALGRLVLDFRLFTIVLSVLALPGNVGSLPGLSAALAVALAVSFVPLLYWERLGPIVMRHPSLLAADLVLSVGILLFTGTDGPFLSYTLGTAFLAGVLYGWIGAAIFAALLTTGYGLVLAFRVPVVGGELGFEALVGVPSRYLLFALGAAAVRELLLRQARTDAALAASEERGRLAREMHDTLAKTLHGIALSARGVAAWVPRDAERAVVEAQGLARAAEDAASQARELIGDLRSDRLEAPLHDAVARFAQEWSTTSGIRLESDIRPIRGVSPTARYELFCILGEALRNVQRHAHADRVWLTLRQTEDRVVLSVADDGVGMEPGNDLDMLAARGHFGLVGISERASRIGARLELAGREPSGLDVTVVASSYARQPAEVG